jgi:hypothetical protein
MRGWGRLVPSEIVKTSGGLATGRRHPDMASFINWSCSCYRVFANIRRHIQPERKRIEPNPL